MVSWLFYMIKGNINSIECRSIIPITCVYRQILVSWQKHNNVKGIEDYWLNKVPPNGEQLLLYICPQVSKSVSFSVTQSLGFSVSQSLNLSVSQFGSLSVCQSLSLSVSQSHCLSLSQFLILSFFQSLSLSGYHSLSLSVSQLLSNSVSESLSLLVQIIASLCELKSWVKGKIPGASFYF